MKSILWLIPELPCFVMALICSNLLVVAQLDVDATVQLLQQLAAQMELSKFRYHLRGEKKKVPKPKRQKDKPHVFTARLLSESKAKKAP